MILIGIPLALGTTVLANKIIILIYGAEYMSSIIALQILVWSTILIFISSPLARLLEVSNKQIVITKITAIVVVVNIVLNIILIPKFSYVAASAITVLSELMVITLILKSVTNIGYGPSKVQVSYFLKSVIASIVMVLTLIILYSLNLFLLILISTVIYFFVLFLIKGFDKDDLDLLKKLAGLQ
jgi:O-antigen/teichoic acid export membrane protein